MISKTTVIEDSSGLHLRPAGALCKEALHYKPKISFEVRTTTANTKSVLSVPGACARSRDEIEFVCEGPDEKEALEAMAGIVEAGLGKQIDGNQRL